MTKRIITVSIFIFIIGMFQFFCSSKNNEKILKTDVDQQKLISTLEETIPKLMEDSMIPGLSIAVIRDGSILWNKGFGVKNTDTKEPVTDETIFEAASLSKPVYAYATLKLVERGELELDKPLMEYVTNEYIEENFLRRKIDDERIAKITARMVLSHSCGFPNWRTQSHLKILFEPGEKYSYSGEGFGFLFLVVEEITGLSLKDFMRKEVFAPLQMNNSSYVWQDKYDELTSLPHDMMMEAKQKRKPSIGHAAASLHTTASDYAKFIMALMNNTGLQKSTIDSMLTPQVISNPDLTQDVFWGLGIGLQKTPDGMSCWHWGDNGDFKCLFLAVPNKKIGMVYFANSANGLMIRKELVDLTIGGDHSLFNDDYLSGYGDPDEPGILFIKKLATKNLESAIDFYNEKRKTMEPAEIVSENKMNQLGYYFLRKKQYQEAIQIFKTNVESFPESSNVYDSLGEAYMNNGDTEPAIINYEKSLELNPENTGAIDYLKKLRQK